MAQGRIDPGVRRLLEESRRLAQVVIEVNHRADTASSRARTILARCEKSAACQWSTWSDDAPANCRGRSVNGS